MKTIAKLTSLAAALCLGVSMSFAAAKVGEKAPDFSLTDINGKEHSLSDYAGKVVVLEWINHGCPFVKKHYESGNIPEMQSSLTQDGVVWLSICSSAEGTQGHMSASEWKKISQKKNSNASAILIDESGEVGRAYGAVTTPHMYVIQSNGTLAYNGAIDSIPSTKEADIQKAENYVVAAVEAVKSGQPVAKSVTKPYGCSVKYKDS